MHDLSKFDIRDTYIWFFYNHRGGLTNSVMRLLMKFAVIKKQQLHLFINSKAQRKKLYAKQKKRFNINFI